MKKPGFAFLNQLPRFPKIVLIVFVCIALFSPILSNNKPVLLIQHGHISSPSLFSNPYTTLFTKEGKPFTVRTDNIDWDTLQTGFVLKALIPYSAGQSDLANSNYTSPLGKQVKDLGAEQKELSFRNRHLLGTGNLGNDVLAGVIEGTRISLSIGLGSMIIAIIIGLSLGIISGYYGNSLMRITRIQAMFMLILFIPAWFLSFTLRSHSIEQSFAYSVFSGVLNLSFSGLLFLLIFFLPAFFINKFSLPTFLGKKITIPIDSIISRIIELFLALPRIIVLITFALLFRPSVFSVILIIGLTSWTGIARMVRALILSLRESTYIDAGRSIGMSNFRLFRKHLLPATFSQLKVFAVYGIASAILAETGLSFLGIGVPPDTVTWGQLLFQGKENVSAWWLVLFPGLCVFLLLLSLNMLADSFEKKNLH
ncbi:MAG TPA: ABC transporter permease [Bacteroidia bacterium]|nr:ABC transporter permease [Bacteroidia bacterium]HNP98278.1 ABC transporter permease [Bacteroidia bacterium]